MTNNYECFPLQMPEIVNGLDKKNSHTRDKRIQFFEDNHIYNVDGREDFVSCTTFIHQFYEPFDADKVITRMMSNNERWKNSKYFGMTKDEIKTLWKNKGSEASHRGTLLHNCIEFYFNGQEAIFPYPQPIEYTTYFKEFVKDIVERNNYIPYRTEWCVFDEEHELAGSIDMIFQVNSDDPDTLLIYDWKRSCKLSEKSNRYQNMCAPLEHLPDTSYWHYCMQLNIYRHILETKYNKNIIGLYLVGIHPDLDTFQQEKVPLLVQETKDVFAYRKQQLKTLAKKSKDIA